MLSDYKQEINGLKEKFDKREPVLGPRRQEK
jgi:hypothetical protein